MTELTIVLMIDGDPSDSLLEACDAVVATFTNDPEVATAKIEIWEPVSADDPNLPQALKEAAKL